MKKAYLSLICILLLIGIFSCQEKEIDTGGFVQVYPSSVVVSVGEGCKIIPTFDSENTAKKKFVWSVSNNDIANITTNEDNSCIVVGVSCGKTYVKIESEDKRFHYSVAITVIEQKLKNLQPLFDKYGISIYNQGERGTCSIFAITGILEFEFTRVGGDFIRLSPEYLNWASNTYNGDSRDGSYFSNAVGGMEKYGICREELMPYQKYFTSPNPSLAAKLDAEKRIGKIEAIWIKPFENTKGISDIQISQIKQQILLGHPVAEGGPWQYRIDENGVMEVPSKRPKSEHSKIFVGFHDYDDTGKNGYFIFRNSWGPGFANEGYGKIPYEYLRKYCNDVLAIHIKNNTKN